MKTQFIAIISFWAICMATIACKKCETMHQAAIIGFDSTKCGCCGGYYIVINQDTFLTQLNLSEKLPLLNTADFIFPLQVKVAFAKEVGNCGNGKRIIVSEISVQ